MGRPSEYLETVLTCEGDYYSPSFTQHLDSFRQKLEQLITDDKPTLIVKKVEPWNSVRVTMNIPADAARRLRELAAQEMRVLQELGILAVHIEGENVLSLAAPRNDTGLNQTATTSCAGNANGSVPDSNREVPSQNSVDKTVQNSSCSLAEQATSSFLPPSVNGEGSASFDNSDINVQLLSCFQSFVRPNPKRKPRTSQPRKRKQTMTVVGESQGGEASQCLQNTDVDRNINFQLNQNQPTFPSALTACGDVTTPAPPKKRKACLKKQKSCSSNDILPDLQGDLFPDDISITHTSTMFEQSSAVSYENVNCREDVQLLVDPVTGELCSVETDDPCTDFKTDIQKLPFNNQNQRLIETEYPSSGHGGLLYQLNPTGNLGSASQQILSPFANSDVNSIRQTEQERRRQEVERIKLSLQEQDYCNSIFETETSGFQSTFGVCNDSIHSLDMQAHGMEMQMHLRELAYHEFAYDNDLLNVDMRANGKLKVKKTGQRISKATNKKPSKKAKADLNVNDMMSGSFLGQESMLESHYPFAANGFNTNGPGSSLGPEALTSQHSPTLNTNCFQNTSGQNLKTFQNDSELFHNMFKPPLLNGNFIAMNGLNADYPIHPALKRTPSIHMNRFAPPPPSPSLIANLIRSKPMMRSQPTVAQLLEQAKHAKIVGQTSVDFGPAAEKVQDSTGCDMPSAFNNPIAHQ